MAFITATAIIAVPVYPTSRISPYFGEPMAEHHCLPEHGWSGIAMALAAAAAGDRVKIGKGLFRGSETLILPSGVTLAGSVETRLEFDGKGPAIMARHANDVAVENLTILVIGTGIAKRALPWTEPLPADDAAPTEWGLVFFDHCLNGKMTGCVVKGDPREEWVRGVVSRLSTNIEIRDCQVSDFGASGVTLVSSVDCVVTNIVASECYNGIVMFRSREDVDASSRARITDNRYLRNRGAGIALFSSESDTLSGNDCHENAGQGILLVRDAVSLDAPSRANITSNRCDQNGEAGIALLSSESGALNGNECCENGGQGIVLMRDVARPDVPSRANITDNRCDRNQEIGIALFSSESDTLSGNECCENPVGILLQRDDKSPDAPSRAARITDNRCLRNQAAAIVLLSSESDMLSGNECHENAGHGIVLARDVASPDVSSRANITGNRCNQNQEVGIALFSSESDILSGNECRENGGQGIALQRDDKSPDAPARAARITDNRCQRNQGVGIVLCSSESDALSGNECWENGNGIMLQRDADSPAFPSRAVITTNRCHDNQRGGIVLASSQSNELSGNECWANGIAGISLERDPCSPTVPAQARITGNRCHGNQHAGIRLSSSQSDELSDNECWKNGSGIGLQRDLKSPDAPSRARITSNQCHHNEIAGIGFLSSESDELRDNECWENGSGIVLQCDADSRDSPSRAIITANRCHHNEIAGIGLASSESSKLHGNECWKNGNGIVLQRDADRSDSPSRAVITANRCHGNQRGGIVLAASQSDELSGNECWENGIAGISLERNLHNPAVPSDARITGNRCHGNQHAGIALLSSESNELSGNECWDNGNGIMLQRYSNSQDAPSRARIVGNRCHENWESGIGLASSESDELNDNECWGNGNGIMLQRYSNSQDAPSRARIVGNRCHGNRGSGIALSSSESNELRDNECWDNGNGIGLHRDGKSPGSPSRAVITANRCHGNQKGGIVLTSSESDELSGNECWANGIAGVSLERDPHSIEAPSRARITGNRCHDNHGVGFSCDAAAEISERDNAVWRNGASSVAIAPNGQILHLLDWDFTVADETQDETAERIRRTAAGGALARILDRENIDAPNRLARFAVASGSVHDLVKCLDDDMDPDVDADRDDEATARATTGLFRLVAPTAEDTAGDANTVRFEMVSQRSLTGAVWDRARTKVLNGQSSAVMIGAFGDNRVAIDSIIHDCELVNGFFADDNEPAKHVPTQSLELIRMLPINGMRIAKPIVIDYAARSELALMQGEPHLAFAEPELSGWQAARSRLRFFVTNAPLILKTAGLVLALLGLLFVAGVVKGFEDPWHDPWGAILRALTSNIESFEAYDWFTLPIAVATALAGFYTVFRRNFPGHLKLETPAWLNRFGRRDAAQDSEPPLRAAPWRRWVKREIFASGDVCFVILRNVQEWLDDDRRALREILAMRPRHKSLVVIVESPTKAILDRTLLRAIYDDEAGRLDLDGLDAVDAFLGTEPGFIDPTTPGDSRDIDNLLGLQGETAELRREQVTAGIRDDEFSIADIIPMIAIGSTCFSPFVLRRRTDPTHRNFAPEFAAALRRYARMIHGDAAFELDFSNDAEALQQSLVEARQSSAVMVFGHKQGRKDFYEFLGRFQRRNDMVRVLADVFGDAPALRAEYVTTMVRCGELQGLDQFVLALSGGESGEPYLNKAMVCLYSAIFLNREYEHLRGSASLAADGIRQNMLDEAWRAALDRLDDLDISDPSAEQISTVARLFAASIQMRDQDIDFNSLLTRPPDALSFAARCFLGRVRHALALFETLDRRFAQDLAINELRPLLVQMPEKDVGKIIDIITSHARRGRDLSQFVDAVSSAHDLTDLMRRHGAILDDALATVFSALAHHARTEKDQLDLAHTVDRLRAKGLRLPGNAMPRGVSKALSAPFEALLGWLEHAGLAEAMDRHGIQHHAVSFETIDLMYGSMSTLKGTAADRMDIEFTGRLEALDAHSNIVAMEAGGALVKTIHSASDIQ